MNGFDYFFTDNVKNARNCAIMQIYYIFIVTASNLKL